MRQLSTLLLVTLLSSTLAYSQTAIGSWSDHFSYNQCQQVHINPKWVYGVTSSGIIRVNVETSEISKLSKINGLSDIDVSAFLPLGSADNYIVGYDNGHIDLYYNGKTYKMPEIKDKIMSGSKRINAFKQINSIVVALTNFGAVIIDPAKAEIKDTWYFGQNNSNVVTYDVALLNDTYYVATEQGLFSASAANNFLSYFGSWQNISPIAAPCVSVHNFSNKLIAVHRTASNSFEVSHIENNNWNLLTTTSNFHSLYSSDNLHITTTGSINTYSQNLTHLSSKTTITTNDNETLTPNFRAIALLPNDTHTWIADFSRGLIKSNIGSYDEFFTPNGPATNSNQKMVHNGKQLIVAAGQQTAVMNNTFFPAQLYFYDGNWTTINGSNDPLLTNQVDLFNISLHPTNPDRAFISSWANGVFEINDRKVEKHYTTTNSPLRWIADFGPYYVRIGGATMDKNDRLYINNSNVNTGMIIITPTEHVALTYKSLIGCYFGDLIIDKNNFVWTIIRRTTRNGVFVFDINNTVTNQIDDRYRGPNTFAQDDDNRNYGQMPLIDQDGAEVTQDVYSIVEDKNGYIWVGTDKGPLVNYRPWAVFNESVPVFNRIKIPRNDGDNLADYLLETEIITCIAVDGANRKWFGTRSAGAFLVSEDGTTTIHEFNTANSPLVSNNIMTIAVDPIKGDVFFGTDKGIVSYKSTATEGQTRYNNVYAYPNPVRPGYTGKITIKGMMANSNVKITSINGTLVYESKSLGGQAVWDGKNLWGEHVKTGVYLVFMVDQYGQENAVSKILIVR
jgi:hypothetical protein